MTQEDEKPVRRVFFQVAAFFTAIRFLTVIPVSWQAERDGRLFPQSVYAFPLVGALIGGLGMLLVALGGLVFPPAVTVFLALFFLAAISGFLHLDGLADSADGLLSARPREQSLAIMKDSRTGAMGVVLLILVLLGKFVALQSLSLDHLLVAVFCLPVAGRTAIVVTMALQRYARSEGGLGNLFYSASSRYAAATGTTLLLGFSLIAGGAAVAAVVCLMLTITVFWFGAFCKRRLGGVTGDTLGAVCELTELSVAIGLSAVWYWQ